MSTEPLLLRLCIGVLLLTAVQATSRCVEIVDVGLLPVVREHIGIQFFVTVVNRGPEATEVEVKKVQCCEDFPGDQSDCEHFQLIPETRVMSPNTTRNFTLIHPTLYPYNRRGKCLLAVHYLTSGNRSKEARQHIAFDTKLSEDNARNGILHQFPSAALVGPGCASVDEDALDSCHVVDCHVKYFGLRSFFNKGSRSCEPIPACLPTRPRHRAPDIVYDVTTNRCRNLSGSLGAEDLQHLAHADLDPECTLRDCNTGMAFVNCHYGQLCNGSGDCRCQPGYVKAVMPQEPGNPRTQLLHSCNVDNSCWTLERFMELPPTSALLIALLLALLVGLCTVCTILGADC